MDFQNRITHQIGTENFKQFINESYEKIPNFKVKHYKVTNGYISFLKKLPNSKRR